MAISWLPPKKTFPKEYQNSDIENYALSVLNPIINSSFIYNGFPVLFKKLNSETVLDEHSRTFDHLIRTKSKITSKRETDIYRCMRIEWLIPVILNATSPDVFIYREIDRKTGKPNEHLFVEEKRYLVILEFNNDKYLIVTAYYIYDNNIFNFYVNKKRSI